MDFASKGSMWAAYIPSSGTIPCTSYTSVNMSPNPNLPCLYRCCATTSFTTLVSNLTCLEAFSMSALKLCTIVSSNTLCNELTLSITFPNLEMGACSSLWSAVIFANTLVSWRAWLRVFKAVREEEAA